MESHHLLSPQQRDFITSRQTLPHNFNKSENLRRVHTLVGKIFNTFEIILHSQKLDQAYINKLFPAEKIKSFLDFLVRYDHVNASIDENNKLEIARDIIRIGFSYYKERFKETKFFSAKIKEIDQLITDLNELSNLQVEEEEKLQLYRQRRGEKVPPDMRQIGADTDWRARCDICWKWSTGKTKADAMKAIRHTKGCTYNKKDLENCIRTFQPRNTIN